MMPAPQRSYGQRKDDERMKTLEGQVNGLQTSVGHMETAVTRVETKLDKLVDTVQQMQIDGASHREKVEALNQRLADLVFGGAPTPRTADNLVKGLRTRLTDYFVIAILILGILMVVVFVNRDILSPEAVKTEKILGGH